MAKRIINKNKFTQNLADIPKENLRRYRISYYAEVNDENVEREVELEGDTLLVALYFFKELRIPHKRVYKVEELVASDTKTN